MLERDVGVVLKSATQSNFNGNGNSRPFPSFSVSHEG
jgi:hypothetical protein